MLPENTNHTLLTLERAGIPAARVGKVTEGKGLTISRQGNISRETQLHCEEDELARMWTIHKER